MFEKIVVVDSTGLNTWGVERLKTLGKEVVFYTGIPETDEETVNRIGDADCVLVSYNTQIRRNVIEACPNIKYIGMCCTLYSESSANVDIAAARERGITVLGIRDYGDEGVVEYVISELVRLLHGFGGKQWKHKAYDALAALKFIQSELEIFRKKKVMSKRMNVPIVQNMKIVSYQLLF